VGIDHPGWDCFVFPRRFVPQMDLGYTCIGSVLFDCTLMVNLDILSDYQAATFARTMMTFHIGDDKAWEGRNDYIVHNSWEALRAVDRIQQRTGGLLRNGSIAHEQQSRMVGWLWKVSTPWDKIVNKFKRRMLLKYPTPTADGFHHHHRTASPEKRLPKELFERLWIHHPTPSIYSPDLPPVPIGEDLDFHRKQQAQAS